MQAAFMTTGSKPGPGVAEGCILESSPYRASAVVLTQLSMKAACIWPTADLRAKLGVAPMFWRVGVSLPEVGQSGAADKPDLPIDNEQLAVIAVIEPGRLNQPSGLYFSTSTPASRITWRSRESTLREPTQSMSTWTLTPARARSASASAIFDLCPPTVNVSFQIDGFPASRMDSSIAGKIWSPLIKALTRLLRRMAGPISGHRPQELRVVH